MLCLNYPILNVRWLDMVRAAIVFCCVVASYFVMTWIVTGIWQKALVTAVLAAAIFCVTLLIASLITEDHPWRAFWLANLILTAIVGGFELYELPLQGMNATRFGGARLFDGRITVAGWASLFFDVGFCVLSNLLGVYLARSLMRRFNL